MGKTLSSARAVSSRDLAAAFGGRSTPLWLPMRSMV